MDGRLDVSRESGTGQKCRMTKITAMKPTTQASANHQRSRKQKIIAAIKNGSKSHRRQQMDHNAPTTARQSDWFEVGDSVRIGNAV